MEFAVLGVKSPEYFETQLSNNLQTTHGKIILLFWIKRSSFDDHLVIKAALIQ